MRIKELAIKTITKKVEELDKAIYIKVYNKKFETIRIGTNRKNATEGFLKQKNDFTLNDLFYIINRILSEDYVEDINRKTLSVEQEKGEKNE